MAKRRRLRKSGGGELEVNMQDVVASDEAIVPSVAVSGEAILLPYVGGGDEGVVESQYFVKQNIAASDAAITQQNVATSDAGIAEQNVVASYAATSEHNVATSDAGGAQQNVAASNEATSEQGVVASDEEIGEQNGALSQLKHKDSIGIDYFRICGHQIKYRLIKLYKFLEV